MAAVAADGIAEEKELTSKARALVGNAVDLANEGDHQGAIVLLDQAIAIEPNLAQAHFEHGMALLELGRDDEAAAPLDRALAIDADFPGARQWRAIVARDQGDHALAASLRIAELRSEQNSPRRIKALGPQAWADAAQSLVDAGDREQARALLEEYFDGPATLVAGQATGETAPMRLLAQLARESGDVGTALAYARRAYESRHRVPVDLLAYALALEASGNRALARVMADQARQVNDQMPGLKEFDELIAP